MLARLYRISAITAILAALTCASPALAAESEAATTANGYTIGGALKNIKGDANTQQDEDASWFSSQLDRLSVIGSPSNAALMPVSGGPFSGYYSPRDSMDALDLNDTSLSGFTPRDSGMLGLVYEAEKWSLGAGYANSPDFGSGDPVKDRIDRYMLGTRYDAFGAVGFGASVELRDSRTNGAEDNGDEKIFTFGTYVNF